MVDSQDKKVEFILGCNYWASNAGAEMWREFDIDVIHKDIKILAQNGVKCIRVFPNWRDFQPVMPLYKDAGSLACYCLEGEREPENDYYLDELMLGRFDSFLTICEKYNVKVIVGLITGWMSGRLFVPPALYDKNVITDPLAQYFEQLFVRGFITQFKYRNSIIAWDLGNECNGMGLVNARWEAANWTALMSNAIRATDAERPVISGMHNLGVTTHWRINDQAMFTDMLTTHPYPYWSEHTRIDEILSYRTLMHPTAQTKFYGEIGGKPCMAEELGTMGPMICCNEYAGSFIRINLFSLWANGATGVMWWCSSDQNHLVTFPYSEQMVERELGMLDEQYQAKPVLEEIKKFSDFLSTLDFNLPSAQADAVCILTRDQRQWGIGYVTYLMFRQAGLNCQFSYGDQMIPDSKLYLLPSINGFQVLPKKQYDILKRKVYEGADLYISVNDGILSGFEELTGMRVIDSYQYPERGSVAIFGEEIQYVRSCNFKMKAVTAQVLVYDQSNEPLITVHTYGKGRVFLVNFPLEDNIVNKHNAFEGKEYILYKSLFKDYLNEYKVNR